MKVFYRAFWFPLPFFFLLVSFYLNTEFVSQSQEQGHPWNYPVARKGNQVDDYHGTMVPDPYRWLENADSMETRQWVEQENRLTSEFLEKISTREKIRQRLTELWNYERYGIPHQEGGRYFFTKNEGLQNQSVFYVRESLSAPARVLLDPNSFSKDGTVAVSNYSISRDGHLMAYGVAGAGSDWTEWKVRDVSTAQDLKDELKWIKFSGASWDAASKGFYYSRYAEPQKGEELKAANYFQKLYYHRIGTPQTEDPLIYERPDHKEWGFGAEVTEDGAYLILRVSQGTDKRNRVYYKDLKPANSKVLALLDDFDASYDFVGNQGPVFYFETDLQAPRGKLIAVDLRQPGREHWKDIIPESAETLQSLHWVNRNWIAVYMKDAHSQVKIFDSTGAFLKELKLPGIGSVSGFSGKMTDTETFYGFTSYTQPLLVFHLDFKKNRSNLFYEPKLKYRPEDYETRQEFCVSRDGTRVPLFLTYRKGLRLNGENPVYLYGYGGFDISLTPSFSVTNLVWMEMGGIYAVANLRGGGEYGETWHQAGMKLKKQNVFNDFLSAAEWLVAQRYTSTPKLAIGGGSNGGLLVGAVLTQRPDLFGAACPDVGVMDMLRFHKFTIGWAWVSDFGSADNPEEFAALYKYSPLHNIKPGTTYPPTLITTADHDDRVVPGHSFKFAAAMQDAQAGAAPVLIRIETRAGHGAGKPTAKIIETAADRWSFLAQVLKMKIN
jgi:prolyl oligopeptidase